MKRTGLFLCIQQFANQVHRHYLRKMLLIIVYINVLKAEPPEWLPDSCAKVCMQCNYPFTALTVGDITVDFVDRSSAEHAQKGDACCLLNSGCEILKRVCNTCHERLKPVQCTLQHFISNAAQSAKHDVMDWTCTGGWLNLPIGLSMEHEIYKAANILTSYRQVASLNPEKSIPQAVLNGASGLAILTVAKAGASLAYKLGTGLVVSRRSDRSWSAPSLSWFRMGSTGAFVGVTLEGTIVPTRMDTNRRFYGDPALTATEILLGGVERPAAARPLYSSLDLMTFLFQPLLKRISEYTFHCFTPLKKCI